MNSAEWHRTSTGGSTSPIYVARTPPSLRSLRFREYRLLAPSQCRQMILAQERIRLVS